MKKVLEFGRFFFISYEFVVLIFGICLQLLFTTQIQLVVSHVKLQDEPLKFLAAIPAALCIWSFVSGRKLLFPDKDKASILQAWPDYWLLKTGFNAALTWNLIFVVVSVIAWTGDWKKASAALWIWLLVSLVGSGISSLSIYNAQNHVEEETSQYKGQK